MATCLLHCDVPNEISDRYQLITLFSAGKRENDELLMCSDWLGVLERVLGADYSPVRLRSLCSCACGVCGHRVMLVCQSIKKQGPVSHQGATHDC